MGFKADLAYSKSSRKSPTKNSTSNYAKKDENNDERDSIKRAPSKTYSRGNSSRSKQLNIDAFTSKIAANSDNQLVLSISRPKTAKTAARAIKSDALFLPSEAHNDRSCKDNDDEFIFNHDTPDVDLDSDPLSKQTQSTTEKVGNDSDDFEYNSDELAELDSGDPEIIFNSPQKRRREAQKQKQSKTNKQGSSSLKSEPSTAVAKTRLFADSDDSDTDTDCALTSHFSSSQPAPKTYGMKPNQGLSSKSKSFAHGFSPSKFFPELTRTASASSMESCQSTNSADGVVKAKKSLSLSSKLLSMDAQRKLKSTDAPVVRRLLTSPKKVYNFALMKL